jgi:uncharacterized membrane protein YbhN (UPF0104 family)
MTPRVVIDDASSVVSLDGTPASALPVPLGPLPAPLGGAGGRIGRGLSARLHTLFGDVITDDVLPGRGLAGLAAPGGGTTAGTAVTGGTAVGGGEAMAASPAAASATDALTAPVGTEPAGRSDSRWRRRLPIVLGLAGAVLVALLATRLRSDIVTELSEVPAPRWPWLVVCAAGAGTYYAATGLNLKAAAGTRASLGSLTASQLAASAANRILPAGIGAFAVNVRYLHNRGLSKTAGVTSVGVSRASCLLAHGVCLALIAALGSTGTTDTTSMGVPSFGQVWFYAGMGIAAVVVVAVLHPRSRAALAPAARAARSHLGALVHSPRRAGLLAASALATKVASVVALWSTVRAFDGHVPFMTIAAVFLVGAAVAGVAPTAGNVGALEPALAIGLSAAGGGASAMLAAVLVYRIITYWLPILPGLAALAALRRRGEL